MANWKSCIPANPKYEGALNSFWLMNTSVVPHESVSCKVQVMYQNGALANEFVNISGDEYKEWTADDDWLYHKIAHKLALGTLAGTDAPYVPAPALATATQDDNRSVHNDSDIAKIKTLEEQMLDQQRLVSQLKQILISKGMI
jgi:hypothetical protein